MPLLACKQNEVHPYRLCDEFFDSLFNVVNALKICWPSVSLHLKCTHLCCIVTYNRVVALQVVMLCLRNPSTGEIVNH